MGSLGTPPIGPRISATALPRTRLDKHFSAATFRGSREQQRQNLKTTVAAIRDLREDVELLTHSTEGSAEDHNYTPLMLGMINSSVDLITALLDIGASVHTENNKKRTALLSLRQSLMLDELSCLKCVKALVSRGANINHRAEGNESAILTAAFFKMLDVVEYLLSQGADIDPRDWSPIRKTLLE